MNIDIREADRSTIVLDVQITDRELQSAIDEGVRHLGRRTRVPGFRPGKTPRALLERALGVDRWNPGAPDPIYEEAREHLYERTVLAALQETERDVLELPREPDWTSFQEGVGASYSVRLPVRPAIRLGDYTDYPFRPQVDPVTEDHVDQVVEQLRDQYASLVPVEDRPARTDDYAVVRFEGRRDGQPLDGARAERFPLIIGRERMIPGFESNLIGMNEDEERTFTAVFPDDYPDEALRAEEVEFTVALLELRERRLPEADDDFAGMVGPYADMAALRGELRARMSTNALDRARHAFADRIVEYATANATVELPDVMVDREVEVLLDELRVRVAQQGIRFEDYLRVTEKTDEALREDYREGAEHRVKVLLVLEAIAAEETVAVSDTEVEAEVASVRADASASRSVIEYLDSERGRTYIRDQLRRSKVVELLVDDWIAGHPEFANVQHQHQPYDHDGSGSHAPGEPGAPDPVAEALADDTVENEDDDEHQMVALEQAAARGALT